MQLHQYPMLLLKAPPDAKLESYSMLSIANFDFTPHDTLHAAVGTATVVGSTHCAILVSELATSMIS